MRHTQLRRITEWKIGGNKKIDLSRTRVMGILNVTPDSFSDGGNYSDAEKAVARAREMAEEGADIIDVGGQSTRPGHIPISPEEEWSRIEPVLKTLCVDGKLIISVDTYYPQVALKAMESGAHIINDVTGFSDPLMRKYASLHKVGCVIMHDIPLDENADVCAELTKFFRRRTAECIADGIDKKYICLDPGVGFGKSYNQNLAIARDFGKICLENYPMLAAASRKRVIGMSCGNPPADSRMPGTVAYHTACILGGANIIRVHDVTEAVQAAKVTDAIMERVNLK